MNVRRLLDSCRLLVVILTLSACAANEGEPLSSSAQEALATTQPLTATLAVTSRWSSGYCANVNVENTGPQPINGWSVVIRPDGTLTSSWNAIVSMTAGRLSVGPAAYNGVLEVGATAQFGYCAAASGAARPTVLSATGQVGDPGVGYSATLALDSDWGSGYCATVRVTNETSARLWTWTAVVELNASLLTSIWNGKAAVSGSRLTVTPQSYNSVLDAGASTSFGFCARSTGADYRPRLISPQTGHTTALTVAVYLPRRIATCFIGDPCDPGSEGCIGLRNDDNALVECFLDATMQAVRTSSPERSSARKERCVEMVMNDQERSEIFGELAAFQTNVRNWSHDAIQLELRTIELESLDMDESRWGAGVWIGPWNLAEFVRPRLDFVPDFNLVIPPIRDPELRLHHDLGGCGGTFGADIGIAGAGWSWVPKTKSSFWFDCAEQPVVTHEWLHQVHYGYQNLSGFSDLYGWSLPGCGMGDPDVLRWFPDSHQCNEDPDYERCGSGDCGGNDAVNSHILSAHWDARLSFASNHCKDGVQDYDETGPDLGPSCSLTAARTAARTALLPRAPAHAAPTP